MSSTRNGSPPGAKYPAREPFFMVRYLRVLSRSGALHFIGSDGYWLLSEIVLIEDKLGYSRPVAFTIQALVDRSGWQRDKVIRVRKRCIEQGWLHHEPGRKGFPSLHWVMVPDWVHWTDDDTEMRSAPCDRKPTENGIQSHPADRKPTESPTESTTHSHLNPNPKKERALSNGKARSNYSDDFEHFWKACPRKVSKRAAWKAWPKALKLAAESEHRRDDEPVAEFLTRRMADYAEQVSGDEERFVAYPSSWLNAGRWDDETKKRVATAEELKNWRP